MKKFIYYAILSVFLSTFICGQSLAASVPSSSSVPVQALLKQSISQAEALLEQGDYEKAYESYSRLLREEPESVLINLGYARAAVRTQRPGQAVMAYERLLAKFPEEPILLKELAYALSMQNDNQRAAMELAKDTSDGSEQNTDLAEKWKNQHSRTQISGKVQAGVMFDSNVNSGPASNEFTIGRWDVKLKDGKAKESIAGYLGAQLDMGYRLDIVSPWWIVGSVNAFARYNGNPELYDMKLSTSEFGSGSAGIRYLSNKNMFDIRARAQIFDYGFDQNVFAIGPTATYIHAVSPQVHLITRGSIDSRTYSNNQDYNGWYGSAGQYVRIFMGEARHSVTFGGRYIGGSAEQSNLTYDGFEANLEFTFKLPHDIKLSPFASYGGEYYYGPATALESEYRRDHTMRAGLNIEVPINEDWSIEASYQYMKNFSNSPLYEYDQHLTRLGIAWSF